MKSLELRVAKKLEKFGQTELASKIFDEYEKSLHDTLDEGYYLNSELECLMRAQVEAGFIHAVKDGADRLKEISQGEEDPIEERPLLLAVTAANAASSNFVSL